VLVYSRFFWVEFHVNNSRRVEKSSSITLPFDLSCRGFFFLGDDGDFRVTDYASVTDRTENTMFRLLL
jgi:hypothetical protein